MRRVSRSAVDYHRDILRDLERRCEIELTYCRHIVHIFAILEASARFGGRGVEPYFKTRWLTEAVERCVFSYFFDAELVSDVAEEVVAGAAERADDAL